VAATGDASQDLTVSPAEEEAISFEASLMMTRLLFLLFGDDAGLWERGAFTRFVHQRTARTAPTLVLSLHQLLVGGADRETNIVSALVESVTRLVVQELLEGVQQDFPGGRGRYDRLGDGQTGGRNGYERG
jgi:hypothetical protein